MSEPRSDRETDAGRCAECGAALHPDDLDCPRCGAHLAQPLGFHPLGCLVVLLGLFLLVLKGKDLF